MICSGVDISVWLYPYNNPEWFSLVDEMFLKVGLDIPDFVFPSQYGGSIYL